MSAGLVFSPWLVDGHLLTVSPRGLPSIGVCVLISSFFFFNFIYLVVLGLGCGRHAP